MPPESAYSFKHALVQDAAYSTLLRSDRQRLHARIAEAVEGHFPDRVAREPELLAHHHTEACQIERAVGYWLKAGERAAQRSANLEAIRHLTRGLEALNTLPENFERDRQELAFQIAIGTPMIAVHGYSAPQTGAAYGRARALCERLGEAEPLVATLSGEFVYYFVRGDYSVMRRLTDEARQVAERLPSPLIRLASHRLAGITAMHFGAFAEARSEFEAILRLYDAPRHRSQPVHYVHDPKVSALTYLAPVLWMLGFPEQARRSSSAAFHCAAELDQANLTAHVHNFAGAGLDELLGNVPGVQAHAEAIIELADRHSLGYWRVNGLILRGWAMVQQGAPEPGIALMCQNAENRAAQGVSWYQARYLCMLAAAYAQVGQAEPGLRIVAEVEDLIAKNREHMWEGELTRIKGELMRVQGRSASEIETCLARAMAISRAQGAKSLELRAARSLARLWCDRGRPSDARALLAPLFSWFTEGFETADLKATKALLDELTCGDERIYAVLPSAKLEPLGLRSRVKTTAFGTFETCPLILRMSVHRGRPEVTGAQPTDANDPNRNSPHCSGLYQIGEPAIKSAPRLRTPEVREMAESINISRLRGPSTLLRYGLAVFAVSAATIIQQFGDKHFAVTPSYVCAVLLTAWLGGLGPALFAIALSNLALMYYFVPPTRTFVIDAKYISSLIMFSLAALFVTWLSGRVRRTTRSLVYARNQLDLKIHEIRKTNEALQAEITERKRAEERLRVQHTVAQLLAEAATIEEVTPRILRAMGECLRWDVGALWRVDREAEALRCVELWHNASIEIPEFERADWQFTFGPGLGLPGRVWSSRKPAYIPDVVLDKNLPRGPIAEREGLHAAIGFPILLGSEVLGVIEFFSREIRQPDQELLDMVATIGSQIGQFIERKRAEETLMRSKDYLAEAQKLTHTGSWAWDTRTEQVLFCSEEMFHIFGLDPRSSLPSRENFRQQIHPEDRDWVKERFEESLRKKIDTCAEYRVLRLDGTVRHISASGHPVLNEDGELIQFVGTAVDVTKRKQAEESLRESEANLAHMNRVSTMGELAASLSHEIAQPIASARTTPGRPRIS